MIEILSNFLRSVIVLTPDNLLQCVYLCLNKLAPAYEGMELGIGDTVLMRAIAQTTGIFQCIFQTGRFKPIWPFMCPSKQFMATFTLKLFTKHWVKYQRHLDRIISVIIE